MPMGVKDLARLQRIAEASWLAKSQQLRETAAEEQRLMSKLDALAAGKRSSVDHLADTGGGAEGQLASTARWMRWAERERHRLNLKLARVRAELAERQAGARSAFGRQNAIDTLLKAAIKKNRDRRS